jgi:hypothetical protein
MLTSIDMIATTRLQAINKYRRFLSRDETKVDICDDIIRSHPPTMSNASGDREVGKFRCCPSGKFRSFAVA